MIKSMTGFGRGQADGWVTEIRSVNHRFGDIHLRLPRSLSSLETRFKKEIKNWVKRGRVECQCLPDASREDTVGLTLDAERADQIHALLSQLTARFNLDEKIRLDQLIAFPDIFRSAEDSPDLEKLWGEIMPSLIQALESHDRARSSEGENLMVGVKASLSEIERLLRKIEERAPEVVELYRERLTKRIETLLPGEKLDEGRLMQEVALFAERSDINEELARLMSHLEHFHGMLDKPGPHGRQMEFLLQEMNREINTIGSKGNDMQISQWVVVCKSEVEKIREQILNLE